VGLRSRLPRPLRGVGNAREVWSWGMYDLANQSFALLIITMLFSVYVREVAVAPPAGLDADLADRRGTFAWSLMQGGSMVAVVVLSPLVGAWADARGRRKRLLMATGVCAGVLTCALGLVGPGMALLAAALYVPANICFQLGENFLASFLPLIASRRTIGRISAFGWAMGYAGALVLLVIVGAGMLALGRQEPGAWRPFFVFAGLWFLVGIVPAGLFLRPDPPARDGSAGGASALARVGRTLAHARRHRQLWRFLLAFLIYGFGVQTIIAFAGIIARDFGFGRVALVLFIAQLTATAGLAAALTGRFQDRLGARNTVVLYLGVWVASCAGMVAISAVFGNTGPAWPLWVVGNGLGFALGGIGTASRSMVARLTPRDRTAEFFGLWGVAYKAAGAVGVLGFGAVARYLGELASLVLLGGFFLVGLVLVLRVNERAGVREALRAERAGRPDHPPASPPPPLGP